MLVILFFLLTGVSLGLFADKISALLKLDERIFTPAVYLVLFMLAITTGLDEKIVESLDSLGWLSFIIIVCAVTLIGVIIWSFFKSIFQRVYKRYLKI